MFKLTWNLCVFRAQPRQLPYSVVLLMSAMVVHFSTAFLLISIASTSLWAGTWKTLLLELCLGGFTVAVLRLRGLAGHLYRVRFMQTYISLLASNTLILALIAIPYLIISVCMVSSPTEWIYYTGVVINTVLLLLGSTWMFMIYSNIYHHALQISVNQGIIVALILLGVTAGVFSLFALL